MATDLRPEYKTIEQQFTDPFYAKYMAEQWGIDVGYNTIPGYLATMRMELVVWQQNMDCSNSLCTQALATGVTVTSLASGTATNHIIGPCCNDNTRFQPL